MSEIAALDPEQKCSRAEIVLDRVPTPAIGSPMARQRCTMQDLWLKLMQIVQQLSIANCFKFHFVLSTIFVFINHNFLLLMI